MLTVWLDLVILVQSAVKWLIMSVVQLVLVLLHVGIVSVLFQQERKNFISSKLTNIHLVNSTQNE